MALLFGLVAEPIQELVSSGMTWPYLLVRWFFRAWPTDQDQTSQLGAWFGAVAGALIAAAVIEASRRKARAHVAQWPAAPARKSAIVASRARRLVANPLAISWFNRAGGTLLIGAGLATARATNN